MKSCNVFLKINPSCLKVKRTEEEYNRVKSHSVGVYATRLYLFYTLDEPNPVPYREFYQELRQLFYFDKYICKHGTEFVYYIDIPDQVIHEDMPDDIIKIVTPFTRS